MQIILYMYCVKISLEPPSCTVPAVASTTDVAAPAVTASPAPSTSGFLAAPPATVRSQRQWAARGRRRPNTVRHRDQSDATEQISALAQFKSTYYKRKLDLKLQQHELLVKEHEKRMQVLDLQERYYSAKCRKLEE